ncbi:MAG: GNAT family N-acetyltransferase [Chlorobi bacterium]|nr:GNAT family N-acetyltransferase [Chlorobiota bacterium]
MAKISYSVRAMRTDDIFAAMRLKDIEDWNQTQRDWEVFIKNNPDLCLVADLKGLVIGTATAINYSNQVSWISMVLVDKEFRGLGISKKLLARLMENLTFCRSLKLDATPAGIMVYKKMGFVAEYKIIRMIHPSLDLKLPEKYDILPVQAGNEDIDEIVKFDQRIFGADRTILIEAFIRDYPDRVWILRKHNRITGYALGRKGTKYNQTGPVYALSVKDAKALVKKSFESNVGQPVVVDIPEDKTALTEWLLSVGFTTQRSFTRMHYKENPHPGEINKQYLICGPEFG